MDEPSSPMSLEELTRKNIELTKELEALQAERQVIWPLLVEVSRRLQISSASIKAAVSSLLGYDIFWDGANQHEFLETIDASVDQAGELVLLLSLAFRLESGMLELKTEPQNLQEILANVQSRRFIKFPNLDLELILPLEGKPVKVDFEYLTLAFTLLFEVLKSGQAGGKIIISLREEPHEWIVEMDGINRSIVELIHTMHNCQVDAEYLAEMINPEDAIRLHIVCKLLHMQDVQINPSQTVEGEPRLHFQVPVFIDPVT